MTSRLEQLLEFYREQPPDDFTRFAIATEYRRAGDLDMARQFLQELVEESPAYVGTYYHLGKLYEELGEEAEARSTYRAGIAIAGQAGDGHARAELQAALMELEMDDDW